MEVVFEFAVRGLIILAPIVIGGYIIVDGINNGDWHR